LLRVKHEYGWDESKRGITVAITLISVENIPAETCDIVSADRVCVIVGMRD